MPEFSINQETHLVSKSFTSRYDKLYSRLCEGFFTTNPLKHRTRLSWSIAHTADEIIGIPSRFLLMHKNKIVANRISFATFQGTYTCNCKYIAEQIRERSLNCELFFHVPAKVYEQYQDYDFPPNIFLVRKNTAESFYILSTSSVWIDNALNCIWKPVPKKSSQLYLNTWHGSLGIKRLGGAKYWKMIARLGDRQIDYFLTDSVYDEKVYRTSFWPHVRHLKFGHPRNDIFFDQEKCSALRRKIHEYYQIPDSVHLILYAPTFRTNKTDINAVRIDYSLLSRVLTERFGGDWIVLNRFHFHNKEAIDAQDRNISEDSVIDASDYPDIQELLAAADVGITDYSSWIFDYLFTGRPGFIYAADIDAYRNSRGFYYSLDKTPFSISTSPEELRQNILSFDETVYNRKVLSFLKKMGCYENGTASAQTVDFILNHITGA